MAIHFSILPSPAKKENSLTDSNKCIICRKVGKNLLYNISCSRILTIEEIAGMVYNDTPLRLKTELPSTNSQIGIKVIEKQRTGTGAIKRQIPLLKPKWEINKYHK